MHYDGKGNMDGVVVHHDGKGNIDGECTMMGRGM